MGWLSHPLTTFAIVPIVPIVDFGFADPEYERAFRAYSNYFEDLAGVIGGTYGWSETLVAGVHDGVGDHPPIKRIQRRRFDAPRIDAVARGLRMSWGFMNRCGREIEDDDYDLEANAILPTSAYYAVYHAARAYAIASSQQAKPDHRSTLNLMSKEIADRGLLPHPWCITCSGCPQIDQVSWRGLGHVPGSVHVLSRPDPESSDDRYAMFLRTTRERELARRFAHERTKQVRPGKTRKNLSRDDKIRVANGLLPTTMFDVFWRLRKKSNYEDADVFVLGAMNDVDARRFGEGLVIVTDATVAALEVAVSAYTGSEFLAETAADYFLRKRCADASPLGRRMTSWARGQRPRVGIVDPQPPPRTRAPHDPWELAT